MAKGKLHHHSPVNGHVAKYPPGERDTNPRTPTTMLPDYEWR